MKLAVHSVEKYTKTLSRWKIFRETTQQKSANSAFTNEFFSSIRGQFWAKRTKLNLKTSTYSWIHTEEIFFEPMYIFRDMIIWQTEYRSNLIAHKYFPHQPTAIEYYSQGTQSPSSGRNLYFPRFSTNIC